jgi:hypothetical protein
MLSPARTAAQHLPDRPNANPRHQTGNRHKTTSPGRRQNATRVTWPPARVTADLHADRRFTAWPAPGADLDDRRGFVLGHAKSGNAMLGENLEKLTSRRMLDRLPLLSG